MTLPLLVLRPEPAASATAARASAMGLHPICYPLFEIRPVAWHAPEPFTFDAMMLTSSNTLLHAGPGLDRYRGLPLYAVGEATAATARERGFNVVAAGDSGAQKISGLMAARGHARVLHPCGQDLRPFDPGPLVITRAVVYQSVEAGDAQGLAAILPDEALALLHSPRAAQRLAQLVPMKERKRLHLAAISPNVLDAAGAGWASGDAAPQTSDQALLALAATLCK